MTNKRFGSVEAGGTKFILAVADENFDIITESRVKTTSPTETLAECVKFFEDNPVDALGIGSFGPIDIIKSSPTYGSILATPKPGWEGVNMLHTFADALHVPIYFTTDVNSSAYGEFIAGNGQGSSSLVYITVGTGIGAGAIQDGQFIGGASHLEMGHLPAFKRADDDYTGFCPFHHDHCYEGLAAGPTIEGRTGKKGETIPRTDPVFDLISYYVGQLCFSTLVSLSPQKIIIGGSVITETELPAVRKYASQFNNGYVAEPDWDKFIVATGVENNGSATVGNFALAKQVLEESNK